MWGPETISFYSTLLMVFSSFMPAINPFGGSMLFLSMTNGISHEERAKFTRRSFGESLCRKSDFEFFRHLD